VKARAQRTLAQLIIIDDAGHGGCASRYGCTPFSTNTIKTGQDEFGAPGTSLLEPDASQFPKDERSGGQAWPVP
jgi:hypothetical protein